MRRPSIENTSAAARPSSAHAWTVVSAAASLMAGTAAARMVASLMGLRAAHSGLRVMELTAAKGLCCGSLLATIVVYRCWSAAFFCGQCRRAGLRRDLARELLHETYCTYDVGRQLVTVTAAKRSCTAMDWRHRSACLDEDPELFFPIGNTGPAILQIEEAKTVCHRCEVREQCLAWALEAGQDHGVWGGMSEDERRALKRRKARARIRA